MIVTQGFSFYMGVPIRKGPKQKLPSSHDHCHAGVAITPNRIECNEEGAVAGLEYQKADPFSHLKLGEQILRFNSDPMADCA